MTLWNRILAALLFVGLADPAIAGSPETSPVKTDQSRLEKAARAGAGGILLVGHPMRGQGTAFVISRKYRLLATAAHVADLFQGPRSLYAVINGGWEVIPVERVWYHPALRRQLDEGLEIRSPLAEDGQVSVPGPDVAVLMLGPGPELPAEWPIATPEELKTLGGKALGLLGYPGYGDWPMPGKPSAATLHTGVVQGVEPFRAEEGDHPERRQVIEHSAATPEGSSGSPVFLPNGHVVGVHNILRLSGEEGEEQTGMSVRADCLWELLVYHKLDHLFRIPKDDWLVIVPQAPATDPRRPDLLRAKALVEEARALTTRRDFQAAGSRCNEAIRLAPEYAAAYLQRCRVYMGYCSANWASLDAETKYRYSNWELDDAVAGFHLDPERIDSLLLVLQIHLYMGHIAADRADYRRIVEEAGALIQQNKLQGYEESFVINLRAQARHFLGDFDGALKDYSESIRLAPTEPVWYVNRAQFWDQRGRKDLAENDRRSAASLARR